MEDHLCWIEIKGKEEYKWNDLVIHDIYIYLVKVELHKAISLSQVFG